jgi:hypothetical protein
MDDAEEYQEKAPLPCVLGGASNASVLLQPRDEFEA